MPKGKTPDGESGEGVGEREVSSKSSKNEILQAYNELLTKVREEQPPDRQELRKRDEQRQTLDRASKHSIDTIVKDLANRKVEIVRAFDTLENQLIEEHRKLTDIQQSIEIERRSLESLYEIKANADSLAALLLAQRQKKDEFEAEIAEARTALEEEISDARLRWSKERETEEQERKERLAEIARQRTREEEEYAYNLQMKRKKDADEYEAWKLSLEKELRETREAFERDLSERESVLAEGEREYSGLKAKVESFPAELEEAVREAEESVRKHLTSIHEHQAELAKKDMESERRLGQQTIVALEAKVKEQEDRVQQLARKMDEAGLQVQTIAVKAIEGASFQRTLYGGYERNKEKERSGRVVGEE